ncbi:hypothetical protein [Tenacibaculum ascidiaceicola]|uniref:hypothetical protein n=1 Tax=Tenacibaculum ascidiaceicola TaxID=1699411 RepID=UPI00389610C4
MFFYQKIVLILLFFLIIFSPSIPVVYNGAILAGLISFFLLLSKKRIKGLSTCWSKNQFIIGIFIFLYLIVSVSLFVCVLHGTYDYSIIKPFINQGVSIFCLIIVIRYAFSVTTKKEELLKILFYTFALQSISILCAMFFPSYHEFVISVSRFSEEMLNFRGGIRTYSLASSNFFGLGAVYGLVYILFLDSVFRYKWFNIKAFFVFVLLVIGTFFIARTGFIGLGIGIFGVLINHFRIVLNPKLLIKFLLLISLLGFSVYSTLSDDVILLINNRVLPFAFEIFMQEEGVSSSSTNALISMWNIPMDGKRLLFGDGEYTTVSGGYYMATDVGYLRNLLFGGLGYFILLLLYQLYLMKFLFKRYKVLFFITLVYILILHMKGEVVGFLIMFQIVLLSYIGILNEGIPRR